MNFNEHSNLNGTHAVFGASQYSWLNYSVEKILNRVDNRYRTALGSELHDFAASQITMGIKHSPIKGLINSIKTFIYYKYHDDGNKDVSNYGLKLISDLSKMPHEVFETLKTYINDGVGFKMTPEVVLFYSENFFGTTDAIAYRNHNLRIHDYKSGDVPANITQLEIYAALFCLEYKIKPSDINIILQLYQNNEVLISNPTSDIIVPIMDKIITFDKAIEKFKMREV